MISAFPRSNVVTVVANNPAIFSIASNSPPTTFSHPAATVVAKETIKNKNTLKGVYI